MERVFWALWLAVFIMILGNSGIVAMDAATSATLQRIDAALPPDLHADTRGLVVSFREMTTVIGQEAWKSPTKAAPPDTAAMMTEGMQSTSRALYVARPGYGFLHEWTSARIGNGEQDGQVPRKTNRQAPAHNIARDSETVYLEKDGMTIVDYVGATNALLYHQRPIASLPGAARRFLPLLTPIPMAPGGLQASYSTSLSDYLRDATQVRARETDEGALVTFSREGATSNTLVLKRQAGRFVLDRLISESSPTQRTTWRFVYTPIEGRLLPEKVFYVIETRHDGAWTPWVRHYVELRHQPDHGAVESHQVRAGKDVSNPDSGVLYRVREDGSFEVVETPVATPAPAAR